MSRLHYRRIMLHGGRTVGWQHFDLREVFPRQEGGEDMAKKAFGGYAIDFKGQTATVESVMGSKPVTPSEMTKKLWAFVKANGLGKK